jgi:hypothetical protein
MMLLPSSPYSSASGHVASLLPFLYRFVSLQLDMFSYNVHFISTHIHVICLLSHLITVLNFIAIAYICRTVH